MTDRSRLLDDRGLKIRKVKPGDEGTYVCRVQNRFGWQEAEATLTVHGQPSELYCMKTILFIHCIGVEAQSTLGQYIFALKLCTKNIKCPNFT